MKTRIFFMSTFFILVFASQTYSQFLTGFGIKAGATYSNDNIIYANIPTLDTKPHYGYNASLFADILQSNYFCLQVEAGYDQRGYRWEFITTDEFGNEIGTSNYSYDNHYVTAGILGKFRCSGESVNPYFLLGPRVDIYAGYTSHIPADVITIPDMTKNPLLEDFKKVNYSVSLGAGIEFNRLLPYKTFIEVNYLPPINTSLVTQYASVKEFSINVKLGINFIKDKVKKTKK
jgi:hypothetical protein